MDGYQTLNGSDVIVDVCKCVLLYDTVKFELLLLDRDFSSLAVPHSLLTAWHLLFLFICHSLRHGVLPVPHSYSPLRLRDVHSE